MPRDSQLIRKAEVIAIMVMGTILTILFEKYLWPLGLPSAYFMGIYVAYRFIPVMNEKKEEKSKEISRDTD